MKVATAIIVALLAAWPALAQPIVFGVLPYLPAAELAERFRGLADTLRQALGRPVALSVAPDYQSLVERIGRDEVDLAYVGPAPYLAVEDRFGPKTVLGRLEVRGSATFRGVIVVRADSPVRSLADLAGRSVAFGDPASTMGHLVPRRLLQEAGIGLEALSGHAFLGSHKNVAVAVLMGEFDAGAIKDGVLEQYRDRGLRALVHTPPISEHFFVATRRLDDATAERARRTLRDLAASRDGRAALDAITPGVTGFDSGPVDLQAIRALLGRPGAHSG